MHTQTYELLCCRLSFSKSILSLANKDGTKLRFCLIRYTVMSINKWHVVGDEIIEGKHLVVDVTWLSSKQ